MTEPISSEELAAWKAQQEANRAARLRQRYSPAELWRRQQQDLADLARLRPVRDAKTEQKSEKK